MKKKKLVIPCALMFFSAIIFGLVLTLKDASNPFLPVIGFVITIFCFIFFAIGVIQVDKIIKEAKLELMDETFYPAFIPLACGMLGFTLSWMIIIPFTHFKDFIQ